MRQNNYSLLALGFFFFLFLIFLAFTPTLTGFATVTLGQTPAAFSPGILNSTFTLSIVGGEFAKNATQLSATVYSGTNAVVSGTKTLHFLLNQTLDLPLMQQEQEYGFGQAGNYILNLSLYQLQVSQSGTYILNLTLFNATAVLDSSALAIAVQAVGVSDGKGQPNITNVTFASAGSLDALASGTLQSEFRIGSYLRCSVQYSGGDLNISFFKPGDIIPGSAYRIFTGTDLTCVNNTCFATLFVNQTFLGQWGCYAEAANTAGKGQPRIGNSLIMRNSPPTLRTPFENLTFPVSSENSSLTLDMSANFFDPDTQNLTYQISGLQHLSFTAAGNNIILTNPNNYQGTDHAQFTVFDGFTSTSSSFITLFVGNGPAAPTSNSTNQTCIPQWACKWDACTGGSQTKTCTDSNSCTDAQNPGGETQNCTEENTSIPEGEIQFTSDQTQTETSSFAWWQILLLVLGVGAMIAGGILFYLQRRKEKNQAVIPQEKSPEQKPAPATETSQQPQIADAQQAQPVAAQTSNLSQLQTYVEQLMTEYGKTQQEIEPALLQAGWNIDDVKKVCKYATLKVFMKTKFDQGFSVEQLKATVLAKGWKPEIVEHALKELGKN
ncbi:hypothetical protein HZB00_02280 [Candidatus Woesearchaeota archaeon]|nr:hypothetical protein [Candidatus Woesearchaeota archaeon]